MTVFIFSQTVILRSLAGKENEKQEDLKNICLKYQT
jgi:hypothetical protein